MLVTVMSGESAKAEKVLFGKFELLERCHTRCGPAGSDLHGSDLSRRRIWTTSLKPMGATFASESTLLSNAQLWH